MVSRILAKGYLLRVLMFVFVSCFVLFAQDNVSVQNSWNFNNKLLDRYDKSNIKDYIIIYFYKLKSDKNTNYRDILAKLLSSFYKQDMYIMVDRWIKQSLHPLDLLKLIKEYDYALRIKKEFKKDVYFSD